MAEESNAKHIARDIREGRFPQKSETLETLPGPTYEGDYWRRAYALSDQLRRHLETRPVVMEEAIEQALDDMGEGHSVCEETKQMLRRALALAENPMGRRNEIIRES